MHRLRTWLRTVDTATFIWSAISGVLRQRHNEASTCSSVCVRPWLRAKEPKTPESQTPGRDKNSAMRSQGAPIWRLRGMTASVTSEPLPGNLSRLRLPSTALPKASWSAAASVDETTLSSP